MRRWPLLTILLAAAGGIASPARAVDWNGCQSPTAAISIAACTDIIASDGQSQREKAAAYRNRGLAYDGEGDHERAIADYTSSIQLKPDFADAYNSRGYAYSEKGDLDNAIADYTQAIGYKPDLILALDNRGLAYESRGLHDLAIADYTKAIGYQPGNAWIYDYRGTAYDNKGAHDRAIADYTKAIKLDPKFAVAYNDRSLVYEAKGEHDKALADLNMAIALKPDYHDAYMQRGMISVNKGSFEQGAFDYGKAAELRPADPYPYKGRGDAYYDMKLYAKAVEDFSKALELKPDYAYAAYDRGLAYAALGLKDKALQDMRMAARLIPAGDAFNAYALTEIAKLEAAPAAVPAAPAPVPQDGTRVALVIGNSSYRSVGLLPNPAKDAELVGAALRNAGVGDVTVVHDLDHDGMIAALRAFARKADQADWAMIYYAGHGMEMDGKNYLIPVDARLESDRDVADETVSLDRMMSAIEGAHRLKLVVLDACRNNPFASQMKMTSAARAIDRGLSRVEPASATLVVYAAKEGTTAQDGNRGDSPFALAFAKRIVEPGVEINKVFRFVTRDVLSDTGNQQEPFVYGSLPPDDFIFVPAK
ncbi:tetratricopeptide repeat protein [Labrys monachus]|uniref:Tetratricopeptide (TPR) repeat protein n=1 Tax=Labrys monachus TaxID=217067 RepID=A0ABU0FP21_9HYPH|nr:tetratricopeptide repeat protein [Labrys monachus]MDQ0396211.1 tetratricopeptide (TPR) repeat protein [Labrys monachus]